MATTRFAVVAMLLAGLVGPTPVASPTREEAGLDAPLERLLQAREYEATENGVGLQAPNRAHGLRSYFEPTGVRVLDRTSAEKAELLALRVSGSGRSETLASVPPGTVSSAGARAEIRRPGLTEWYVNSAAGLEQGFTLDARPEGRGELVIELDVEGARAELVGDRVLFESASGRRLEYAELVVSDAEGRSLPARMELSEAGRLRLVADDSRATYPVVFDPLLTASYDSLLYGNQSNSRLGVSVAGAGDVNGDGYGDVIVGAHQYDSGDTDEGIAVVFLGNPLGIVGIAPVAGANSTIQSNQAGAELGIDVSGAGDVNGDGYDDVIVGAHFYTSGEDHEGVAYVFLGSPSGITPAGNPLNAAAKLEANQGGASFGENVAGAGDVNGDGYADVIVGAPFYNSGEVWEGSAFIFLGSASGIVATGNPTNAATELESDFAGAQFGMGVAGAGDVNGDGYDDVIVGGPFWGSPTEGAAFVFHGSASGIPSAGAGSAQSRIESNQTSGALAAQLGWSVAGAGDVNGDGYGDVIVGAHSYDNGSTDEGIALVFHGSATGIVASGSPANANALLEGNQTSAAFGNSVAAAGDVNGDGYADVIVGAPNYDNPTTDEGNAFVFVGGPTGVGNGSPSNAFATIDIAGTTSQSLGFAVGGAGDVNGDGYADVIVGAWQGDAGFTNDGFALVYNGGAQGVVSGNPATAARMIMPLQGGANFGYGLASAGDVNGDGYGDLIVGAYNYDGGDLNEGAAFVFLGSAAGITATDVTGAASAIHGDDQDDSLGYSVASAGDVNGDGYGDVIIGASGVDDGNANEGAAYIFHGGPSGIVASGSQANANSVIQASQDEAYLGYSVAAAGDVNGDGYGDVLVGGPFYNDPLVDEGAVFVYQGGPSGVVAVGTPANANAVIESNSTGFHMGFSLDGAGDLNGDGYADIAIGAEAYNSNPATEAGEGAVFVYHGGPTGIVASGNPGNANAVFQSNQSGAAAGSSVSGAGDVNRDGYDDLIIGATLFHSPESNEGGAFVFYGGGSGVGNGDPSNADATLQSNQAGAYFGGSVDAAGDVNGDGYADVIIGAEGYNGGTALEGGAFVFLGSSTGIPSGTLANASAVLESNQGSNPNFGLGVGIGDVNGDGFADVAVGARNYDVLAANDGAAFLFYGGGNRTGRSVLARQLRSGGSTIPIAPWGVSNSYQGFDVRMVATHPEGSGLVRLQVQACPAAAAFGAGACTTQTQAAWTSVTPASPSTVLILAVSGLTPETLYHWRARVLHSSQISSVVAPIRAHAPWRRLQAQAQSGDIGTPAIPDTDGDGLFDDVDNCVSVVNPTQQDTDIDGAGDACDADDDGDNLLDVFETGTGTYVSPSNTGSDPLDADSDDDGFQDGFEIAGHANPNDATSQPLFLGFQQLDGADEFTCGVLTNGELACFGNPSSGQASGTFTSVTLGSNFGCAIRNDASVACWGPGAPGLGPAPEPEYLQISAGSGHICGLLPDLTLDCWGSNANGESTPPTLGTFTEVSSASGHSCALGLDGHAECWGMNASGQSTPPAGESFVELAVGLSHSCGLRATGSVLCWGSNANGQTTVTPGTYTQIAAGNTHTCGLTTAGTIQCWGGNASGQTAAPGGTFTAVFAGKSNSCAIAASHRATCWGGNSEGEATPPILPFPDVVLGDGHGCEVTPAQGIRCFGANGSGQASPPALGPVVGLGVGTSHSCALETNGDAVCFGSNTSGQAASQSASGNPFVQVDGGSAHNCGVRATGAATCWGANGAGQSTPDPGSYTQVSAGGIVPTAAHSCGITTAGALLCWGTNTQGQATDQVGSWTQVSAGRAFTCGVRADATLGCFGQNNLGQTNAPAGTFTHVEAGRFHACALAANGTVQCWGDSSNGKTAPPPGSFKRLSVNGDTSCGVLDDGSIACWGVDPTDPSPALDGDDDNRADGGDNCPLTANATQADSDLDGVGDVCDVCVAVQDPDQFDRDGDGVGDACDNCANTYNPDQADDVGPPNGIGNACEDTLVIIRPALPPPPGPPPGAPSGPGAPPPPPAGEKLYDVFVYCPAFPIDKVQLGVIMPENAVTPGSVNFGLGCTASNCLAAVGHGLGANVNAAASFSLGPGLLTNGARPDTVYFSLQANTGVRLCDSNGPDIEVRVAQFQINSPPPDAPTPSVTTSGLAAVGLLAPLTDDAGRVLEPAEYSFVSVNQDPTVALTLEPAAGDTTGHKWQVELDTDLELNRVTFGLLAPAGTNTTQMRFTGCTTPSGPQPTRRSCAANNALGPYVSPATSYTIGPSAATSGLRTDTLYVTVAGARATAAPLPALNVAGQPVVLGVVEFDPSGFTPALTLDGVGTTAVFGPAYVSSSNTTVSTPLVQVGSGYNAPSDYDADGRSDDLDNCPYTPNLNQANNGGFLTTTPDLYGDSCQCADGDGNGAVFAADTAALRTALTGQASAAVVSRCSVAGGPECDVRDYAVFKRALAGMGPGISSVCASAVRSGQ